MEASSCRQSGIPQPLSSGPLGIEAASGILEVEVKSEGWGEWWAERQLDRQATETDSGTRKNLNRSTDNSSAIPVV